MKIHGEEVIIDKVFGTDYLFEIPDFQRPYRWQVSNVEDLFDDIDGAAGDDTNADLDSTTPYFLGSIVLIKHEHSAESQIVDGQQRLTSLSLLLAALRESIEDKRIAEAIASRLETPGDAALGTKGRPRLVVRSENRDFYERYVIRHSGSADLKELPLNRLENEGQRNIRDNYLRLCELCHGLKDNKRQFLLRFLLTKCVVVVVSSPDQDSAYRIFRVLNDRGMILSVADILKAELVSDINQVDQSAYARKWEEAEDLVEEDFEDLLSQIRMIHVRQIIHNLRDELKSQIIDKVGPAEFIDDVLSEYAPIYKEVVDNQLALTSRSDEANDLLGFMSLIDNSEWKSPAMLAVSKYRGVPDQLVSALKDIERLAASMLIRRIGRQKRVRRWSEVLLEIDGGMVSYALTPDEEKDTINTLLGPVYTLNNVARYLLARLEYIGSDRGVKAFNWKRISIEHVLPQNPGSDSQWLTTFSQQDRDEFTHSLGNLILLSRQKNSSARNWSFRDKKERYINNITGTPPFATNSWILTQDEWLPKNIQDRTTQLVRQLADEWRVCDTLDSMI